MTVRRRLPGALTLVVAALLAWGGLFGAGAAAYADSTPLPQIPDQGIPADQALGMQGATEVTQQVQQIDEVTGLDASGATITYRVTGVAGLVFVYVFGQFLCGFGVGSAYVNPFWGEADELGDLYINGNLRSEIASGGVGSTIDETACLHSARGTLWEMHVNASGHWPGGIFRHVSVAVFAFP